MDNEKKQYIRAQLEESAETKRAIARDLSDAILEVAEVVIAALRDGKKVLFCGNGGSAADAQHLATELLSRLRLNRRAIPALALTTDTSLLTAHANDFGFDSVFARQVEALGAPGDILVGISTSGNSENVLQALRVARERGLITIALTGRSGGKMTETADYCLIVPSDDTQRIQEGHIAIGHVLCDLIERELFGNQSEGTS